MVFMHTTHIKYPVQTVGKCGLSMFYFIFGMVPTNDPDTHSVIYGKGKRKDQMSLC